MKTLILVTIFLATLTCVSCSSNSDVDCSVEYGINARLHERVALTNAQSAKDLKTKRLNAGRAYVILKHGR